MTQLLTALFLALPAPAPAQVQASTPTLTVDEAYKPPNRRDPLLPSTVYGDLKGSGELKKAAAPGQAAAAVEKTTFSVYGLKLTGIMEDSRGREALLKDASGAVYTLRAGRLTDAKRAAVPGVSGIVKGKQVTLMTDDKKVIHLNLRENE